MGTCDVPGNDYEVSVVTEFLLNANACAGILDASSQFLPDLEYQVYVVVCDVTGVCPTCVKSLIERACSATARLRALLQGSSLTAVTTFDTTEAGAEAVGANRDALGSALESRLTSGSFASDYGVLSARARVSKPAKKGDDDGSKLALGLGLGLGLGIPMLLGIMHMCYTWWQRWRLAPSV